MANKYFNKPVFVDGVRFDSKKEYQRYLYLTDQEKRGKIANLSRQIKYILIPKQTELVEVQLKTKTKLVEKHLEYPITYTADFVYEVDGKVVVEDVKASKKLAALDNVYPLKRKLLLWVHGIKLKEVYEATEKI